MDTTTSIHLNTNDGMERIYVLAMTAQDIQAMKDYYPIQHIRWDNERQFYFVHACHFSNAIGNFVTGEVLVRVKA